MNASGEADPRLVAYVDGELSAEAAASVERLIAADPRARAEVEMFRSTAMLLRAACGEQHYARPPTRAAAAAPMSAARLRRRQTAALAAGVLLALGGFSGGVLWQAPESDALLAEIAEYHEVISRETTHLAELPPDRSAEFVGWLGERLGRRLSVPDLRGAGLRYAGGRMLVIAGGPVADFLYQRDDGPPVAVCVVRDGRAGGRSGRELQVTERDGLRLAAWAEGGATYIVVGVLDAPTARRIANLVASQIVA